MNNHSSKFGGNPLNRSQSQQQSHHHPHHQQHLHHQQMGADERHMALANLFSSLTDLANNQQHRSQQEQQQQQQMHQQSHIPNINSSIALTSSLQSAVTAAMIQQQFAASSSAGPASSQQLPSTSMSMDAHVAANSMLAHQLGTADPSLMQLPHMPPLSHSQIQQQQQTQRINYCTICNKELCNKYFMKTHMLKMHGINLEMEQPEEEAEPEENGTETGQLKAGEQGAESNSNSTDDDQTWANNDKRSEAKKSTCPSNKASNNQATKKQTSSNKATSVLNGFAGNSMGGVVCDICNKELCSKYFLKVHKQNTHGIMTDYQDTSQFMYPLSVPMAPPNLFINTPPMGASLTGSAAFPPNQLSAFMKQHQSPAPEEGARKSKRPRLSQSKQTSSSTLAFNIDKSNDALVGTNNGTSKQLEAVYRLIFASQQQQQPQPQPPQSMASLQPPAAPPLMTFDPMTTNPLSALMCFGAMGPQGPFGPAGMSPAMIVDHILRNQHLLNRNNNVTNVVGQAPPNKDRNNNDSKQGGNKNAKDTSGNSRYFSHYTEACPMCDRRFKSIKWLKTHMINDHKQEIGAYMHMMMQYLYTSKTQQMAAAATMAALEQQQQQHQQQQQQQQQQNFVQQAKTQSQQVYQTNNIVNKCFPPTSFQYQSNPVMDPSGPLDVSKSQYQDHRNQRIDPKSSPQEQVSDYVIHARYRNESISPNESMNRQSPSSPASRLQLNTFSQDNHNSFGLNFELEKLTDRKDEGFLISQVSRDSSDIIDESSRESEVRVKDEVEEEDEEEDVGEEASSSGKCAQQYEMNTASTN